MPLDSTTPLADVSALFERPPPQYNPRATLPRVNATLAAAIPSTGLLHAYLYSAIPTTHAPPSYHLGAILPVLAYEVARRGIVVSTTMSLPRVWTCLVGGSGHGKSTCHRYARKFAREWHEMLLGENYRDPFLHLDGSIPGILNAASAFYVPELDASVGVFETDEVSKILSQLDSVAETLCQVYDGETITRQLRDFQKRKAAGEKVEDTLRNPAISACFATTPSSLEHVGKGYHLEGGLFARILWFHAALDPSALMPTEIVLPEHRTHTLTMWREWAGWLDGEILLGWDRQMTFEPAAIQLFRRQFDAYRAKLIDERDRVNSARMRAINYAGTIAALYALSCGAMHVSEEDVAAAINLVEMCLTTLVNLDKTVAVSVDQRLRQRVLELVQAHPEGCHKGVFYRRLNVEQKDLEPVLSTLLDAHMIELVPRPAGQVGRPAQIFRVRKDVPT